MYSAGPGGETRKERIIREVRKALDRLTDDERDFVERYYFRAEPIETISALAGVKLRRVNAIHRRALRKLRGYLAGFVRREFGISVYLKNDCPICNSDRRREIEQLLSERKPSETWGPMVARIRDEFAIVITTPHVLIGHEKYH